MTRRLLTACLAALAAGSFLMAQPLKGGGEFQVNVATLGYQQYPAIAASPTGRFVVVWNAWPGDPDGAGVAARIYASSGMPEGGEFQVNTWTTGYQGIPSVAMGMDQEFLVSWDLEGDGDDSGSFGRPFDASGPLPAGEQLLNSYTTDDQFSPSVAGSSGGGFVVVWSSAGQDGSGTGIFARQMDPNGSPLGAEFQVNSYTTGFQTHPDVSVDEAGNFVVVWQGPSLSGYGYGLFARLFDSSGQASGSEFRVDTFATSNRLQPDVSMNAGGEFIVVWQGALLGSTGTDIFAQRFDSGGSPVGGEFQVNFNGTGYQENPSVALDAFGNFEVVWESYGLDLSGHGVFGKAFIYPDQPVGDEFQVNTYTTGHQARPEVAAVGLGDFVTVWHSQGQDGDGYGVFGQRSVIQAFCAGGDSDLDAVCDTFDNCPDVSNADQADVNRNGTGDACDLSVVAPAEGGQVDCSNPALIRPSFSWTAGTYDRFKVFLSPTTAFAKGERLSSGDKWLRGSTWIPSKKKWKKACRLATQASPSSPILYVKITGKDRDLSKKDPRKFSESTPVLVSVLE